MSSTPKPSKESESDGTNRTELPYKGSFRKDKILWEGSFAVTMTHNGRLRKLDFMTPECNSFLRHSPPCLTHKHGYCASNLVCLVQRVSEKESLKSVRHLGITKITAVLQVKITLAKATPIPNFLLSSQKVRF